LERSDGGERPKIDADTVVRVAGALKWEAVLGLAESIFVKVLQTQGPILNAAVKAMIPIAIDQSDKSAALADAKTLHSAVLCPFLSRTARKWL
jgi:hypothetical protein